jgi:hypothetical protein
MTTPRIETIAQADRLMAQADLLIQGDNRDTEERLKRLADALTGLGQAQALYTAAGMGRKAVSAGDMIQLVATLLGIKAGRMGV